MIVSASRRTDIPAFYSEWFCRRIRAGYCEVSNPMNPRQIAKVSLLPEEVDAIVFWTRSPRGILPRLAELDARGFRYYFQVTLCGYGPPIEACNPPKARAIDAFQRLSSLIGSERVIWRYDPVIFSESAAVDFHLRNFESIATALSGFTRRCVLSIWDHYRKLATRLEGLRLRGVHLRQPSPEEIAELIPRLVGICAAHDLELVSCAEEIDLASYGAKKGKCIDDALVERLFGMEVCHSKDRAQRAACGCVQSRDIGAYNSCLFGCAYCYATTSFGTAARNRRKHDPDSAVLIPWDNS